MSNFDSENFVMLVNQLYDSLKNDLSVYRVNYIENNLYQNLLIDFIYDV